MNSCCSFALSLLIVAPSLAPLHALEKQPASAYRGRRVALAARLQTGVAVLFAAEEPQLDFMPYRQDSDFYYLTGWTEPGAALLIEADAPHAVTPRSYREILFLPARNLRMEKYTGVKMDAATPGAAQAAGVDAVEPMT
ncbi:MAG: aminopeptidase P N-terminal domain-containing protein, partial [Terracidiphilus sp.]